MSFDARLDTVPQSPGVYLMKDASGCVVYVGKAKRLKNRLTNYFGGGKITSPKVAAMVSHVADYEYTVVASETEALLLENNFIKRYQPKYNILLRDDKGYPYICITLNEEYPRVIKSFRIDEKLRAQGARYYGPYMNSDLIRVLRTIEELFPLKRCRKQFPRDIGKERPCLNYHIGKCMAPCSGDVTSEQYKEMVERIVMFFEGKYDGIEESLKQGMEEASGNMDYERAAVMRDRLIALKNIRAEKNVFLKVDRDVDAVGLYSDAGETCIRKLELRRGAVTGSSTFFVAGSDEDKNEILEHFLISYYEHAPAIPATILVPFEPEDREGLEEVLSDIAGHKVSLTVPQRGELSDLEKLSVSNAREMMVRRILRGGAANSDPKTPLRILEKYLRLEPDSVSRIESYDISNLGNDDICAGMVVFSDGKPSKNLYRLFKLKEVTTQDDFASMREVLSRRFAHNEEDGFALPDLILIDGGKGQLGAARQAVSDIPVCKNIPMAGMVKNDRHKTSALLTEDGMLIPLEGKDLEDDKVSVLRFLTAVQDEVHRFSVSYQRRLSSKRNIHYKLENIQGIGPAKRRKLLSFFGTIKKISEATEEELQKAPGISEADARAIRYYFDQGDP